MLLEMQKRGSSIMSYNLHMEDMMDKSFNILIDCDVADSSRPSYL